MNRIAPAVACVALLLAGCERAPRLETRTFAVHALAPHQVEALVAPYVYTDRPQNPGMMSTSDRALTVRETPDNLDKIERVLADFDAVRPDVRLRFQVIEADGFTDSDPAIADVETELRKLFQFKGYRLAAQATLTATDGSEISQTLSGSEDQYQVTGGVGWQSGGATQLHVRLWRGHSDVLLETTVNVRPGQTLVLGTSPKRGSTATLLLTLHSESAEG